MKARKVATYVVVLVSVFGVKVIKTFHNSEDAKAYAYFKECVTERQYKVYKKCAERRRPRIRKPDPCPPSACAEIRNVA